MSHQSSSPSANFRKVTHSDCSDLLQGTLFHSAYPIHIKKNIKNLRNTTPFRSDLLLIPRRSQRNPNSLNSSTSHPTTNRTQKEQTLSLFTPPPGHQTSILPHSSPRSRSLLIRPKEVKLLRNVRNTNLLSSPSKPHTTSLSTLPKPTTESLWSIPGTVPPSLGPTPGQRHTASSVSTLVKPYSQLQSRSHVTPLLMTRRCMPWHIPWLQLRGSSMINPQFP